MRIWQWIVLALIAAASLYVELFMLGHHAKHWWNKIPGFYIYWGLGGCLVLMFGAKLYGKLFVMRDKDYYES